MEKRLALALVMCLLYVFFVVPMFMPPPEPTGPTTGEENTENTGNDDETESTGDSDSAPGSGENPSAKSETDETEARDTPFEQTFVEPRGGIVAETDTMIVTFTNVGASIERVEMKDYYDQTGITAESPDAAQHRLVLYTELQSGRRLGAIRHSPPLKNPADDLDRVAWDVSVDREEYGEAPVVSFRYADGAGYVYEKAYRFEKEGLHFEIDVSLRNEGHAKPKNQMNYLMTTGAGIFEEELVAFAEGPRVAVAQQSDDEVDVEMVSVDEVLSEGSVAIHGVRDPILWSGSTNNYFSILVSPTGEGRFQNVDCFGLVDSVRMEDFLDQSLKRLGRPPLDGEIRDAEQELTTNVGCEASFLLSVPEQGSHELKTFRVFAGPKDPALVAQESYRRYEAIVEANYTFGAIEKTLLGILRFFHGLVGNWGIAIILLTILVRALLFPLQRIQSEAMSKYQATMAKLKPKLDEIQKKYKNNLRKYREEQMKIMRESGAKPPVLGCLIMLLPLPVFIGLFISLRTSFELRHAPFFLWIDDLSQPDHLFHWGMDIWHFGTHFNLLPILMTVAWVLQHAVTPVPQEPQAAQMHKIMKWMPVMFGAMLYNYASGLSLYMLVSAILGIIQYKFLKLKTPTM